MKKTWKRLCTGFLALATVVTALPTTPVHAESKQYWTESAERVGIIEKVMNDGSIGSTFNEGYMKVEGETAYCIDINTDFKNGYKTRADASSRMSADQISDVALSLEYVKQYGEAHKELNYKQVYLLEQCVVWQRLSVHLGWQCDNVRASYDEIPKATQDEVFSGARAFVKENKGRYECGGYIYSGEGQELGQFWAKLNVGNAKLKKTSSNTSITDGNGNYSIAGATYGVFSDKDCTKQLALIVFVFLYSGIFTKEYETNTLILILTKGLSRYKVVFAKFFVMFTMWTIGYLLCFAVTYGYNAFFWDNSIAVGLLPAMVHWWLFGVWIIGLIVLFSVLVKSYTGVLLGTGGSVLGVYLISFFPKAWKYTPTTLMESASLLIGTKSIEDYGIAVLITILLVVICLIVSITVMNRKQL